jgi:hypothetical protein
MAKQLILVLSEPTEGCEDEYNDYYENTHLDEVIATTGWKLAQRFKLEDQAGHKCPLPYLALYEAEGDDPASVLRTMNETRSERLQSKSINKRTAGAWVFSAVGPEHIALAD